jgi:hypothetical protein
MAARLNNGLYIAAHGGHNGESHNHNDVGDILVYDDGYPVIIDVGAGTYTSKTFGKSRYDLWFNTSPYHNLATINGQPQMSGKQFAASEVSYLNNNQTVQFKMNLSKAYPVEAKLENWERMLLIDRAKGITISDKYIFKEKPDSIMQTFMTTCTVNLDIPGVIVFIEPNGQKVKLGYDKNQWAVSKEKIQLTQPEDAKFLVTWEGRDIWRILLRNTSLMQIDQFQYGISK